MKYSIEDVWKIRQVPPPFMEKVKAEEEAKKKLEVEGETPEGEKPEEKSDEPKDIDELLKKSRDELNALAEEKGLDPDDYHNKEEVAKAIIEAEG